MPLLNLDRKTVRYNGHSILSDISLTIEAGEKIALIGQSGAGKSVLVKHLVGLLAPDGGEIWLDGEEVSRFSEDQMFDVRMKFAMVFQQSTLFDSMTLQENVALPLRKHKGMRHADAMNAALGRLDQVHMTEFATRYPAELSDGMRKRAAIARTLTLEPEVVLFDEPTTGLDPVAARRIDRLIRGLSDTLGVTSIVVSHDLESIFSIADHIAFIYQGVVHLYGTREDFKNSDDLVVQQFITGSSEGPITDDS